MENTNTTVPLIPSTSELNAKLMEIVGQYTSIETSYLRVISSLYNENVQLKEINTELKKRLDQVEQEQAFQQSFKRAREEESECSEIRTTSESHEDTKVSESYNTEALRQKNIMLGREIHAKNAKLQNQAKKLKEYTEIIKELRENK